MDKKQDLQIPNGRMDEQMARYKRSPTDKNFLPKTQPKNVQKLLTYDKQTCGKLFRWISGHSFHRYHNHLTNPGTFNNPTCRACSTEREETSHLYAYCAGLSQLRMKNFGTDVFQEKFTWTPTTLLTMIRDIDKVCPEEGTFDPLIHEPNTDHEDDQLHNHG
jgi:hypothetical protein